MARRILRSPSTTLEGAMQVRGPKLKLHWLHGVEQGFLISLYNGYIFIKFTGLFKLWRQN